VAKYALVRTLEEAYAAREAGLLYWTDSGMRVTTHLTGANFIIPNSRYIELGKWGILVEEEDGS
jgi:hypothetical protein